MSSEIVGSQIVKTLKMFKKSFSHDKLMNLLNEIKELTNLLSVQSPESNVKFEFIFRNESVPQD